MLISSGTVYGSVTRLARARSVAVLRHEVAAILTDVTAGPVLRNFSGCTISKVHV